MRVMATQEFYYGKQRQIGDVFDAPELHARLLKQGGRVKDADAKEMETVPIKMQEVIEAEAKVTINRRYKRRDMRPIE